MTETTKEQARAVGGPERRLLPVVARLVGWLIFPLYIASTGLMVPVFNGKGD